MARKRLGKVDPAFDVKWHISASIRMFVLDRHTLIIILQNMILYGYYLRLKYPNNKNCRSMSLICKRVFIKHIFQITICVSYI